MERGIRVGKQRVQRLMRRHGIRPSMSRGGNCWDNAVTETLFGSLKAEWLHGEHFPSIRAAKGAVLDWLLWYNRQCMHSTLRYVSPARYEQDWSQKQQGGGSVGISCGDSHTFTATTTAGLSSL